jgi:tripartite-type tricarboxylate transporter receptor subunit TctC
LVLAAAAHAYPDRPIKLIVPFGAGGSTDVLARTIGQEMAKSLKQPVVVENKAGASGMIGATACKQAAPDGYTMCMVISDILVVNPFTFKKLAYDAEKDFVPVAAVADAIAGITIPTSHPAKTLPELIAYSKANPNKVNWASYGIGTASHLLLEAINQSTGAGFSHIPYKSVPDMNTALLAGDVHISMMATGLYEQFVKEGKMRHAAVMGEKRAAALPDVPTVVELGVDFRAVPWFAIFAPAGTPPEIVEIVNRAVNAVLADPVVSKTIASQGYTITRLTSAQLGDKTKRDRAIWGAIAKTLNLNLE